jgi:hypothetical protein
MGAVLQLMGVIASCPTRRACVSSIVQNESSMIVPKMSPDYKIPDQKVGSYILLIKPWKTSYTYMLYYINLYFNLI